MSQRRSFEDFLNDGDGVEAVMIKIIKDYVFRHLLYEKRSAVSLAKG